MPEPISSRLRPITMKPSVILPLPAGALVLTGCGTSRPRARGLLRGRLRADPEAPSARPARLRAPHPRSVRAHRTPPVSRRRPSSPRSTWTATAPAIGSGSPRPRAPAPTWCSRRWARATSPRRSRPTVRPSARRSGSPCRGTRRPAGHPAGAPPRRLPAAGLRRRGRRARGADRRDASLFPFVATDVHGAPADRRLRRGQDRAHQGGRPRAGRRGVRLGRRADDVRRGGQRGHPQGRPRRSPTTCCRSSSGRSYPELVGHAAVPSCRLSGLDARPQATRVFGALFAVWPGVALRARRPARRRSWSSARPGSSPRQP